jgi:hypothetical protein
VLSQQLQGLLQTQHTADIGNYIMDKHNIKSRVKYRKVQEQKTIMLKIKQTKTSKQTKIMGNNNYITQNIKTENK